jgi:hypothetical protein
VVSSTTASSAAFRGALWRSESCWRSLQEYLQVRIRQDHGTDVPALYHGPSGPPRPGGSAPLDVQQDTPDLRVSRDPGSRGRDLRGAKADLLDLRAADSHAVGQQLDLPGELREGPCILDVRGPLQRQQGHGAVGRARVEVDDAKTRRDRTRDRTLPASGGTVNGYENAFHRWGQYI